MSLSNFVLLIFLASLGEQYVSICLSVFSLLSIVIAFSTTRALSSDAISTQNVFSTAYEFKMQRIATRRSAAQVVELSMQAAPWKGMDKPRKHKPVRSLSASLKVANPIAVVTSSVTPNPARRSIMLEVLANLNLSEDSFKFFSCKAGYGKILNSHLANVLSSLVEPFRVFTAPWRLVHCNMETMS